MPGARGVGFVGGGEAEGSRGWLWVFEGGCEGAVVDGMMPVQVLRRRLEPGRNSVQWL